MTASTLTARGSILIGPIQDALAAALASAVALPGDTRSAAQLLAGVTVLSVAPHEVIEEVLARAAGLRNSLFIWPPAIRRLSANIGGAQFWADDIEIRLTIQDNPKLNASGLNVYALIERVLYIVTLQQLVVAGVAINPLWPDPETTRPAKTAVGNAYNLVFHTSAGVSAPFP